MKIGKEDAINFNQPQYFMAVAKTKSFPEVAYDLFVSQSSISKQIKSLEDDLGVILFDRSNYHRFFTPAGQVFMRHAESMMPLQRDMLLAMEPFREDCSGILRIGSIPVVSIYGIGERLANFQHIYRERKIDFDMHEGNQYDVLRELNNGVIDLAIVRLENIANLKDYDTLLYAVDEFVLVCAKRHPLAKHRRVSLDVVAQYPLYLIEKKSKLSYLVIRTFEKENIPLPEVGTTSRHKILLELLGRTENVSILPKALVDLKNYPLVATIDLEKPFYSQVALIRRKGKKYNKITRAFWDFWQSHYTMPHNNTILSTEKADSAE